MRCLICFAVLAVIVALAYGSPVAEEYPAVADVDQAEALLSVDGQGHENAGDREARQFGYGGFGGYRGGYGGGFGGYRGGYGGGFGGYRGGFGGYRGGLGGYRGGFGGYRGGFFG